ncbi:acyclic terpene utilization AtuA family protein [Ideonella sp. BN130291]|uniref:acyclic terpene utilization AtuA family protein n=1 Tax=Ideonella sp. BN130291 TaxID=3112940 RepID=UPI002E255283|nr:acyclic terpene utilization AtuA family protein [Ideonella sp. BN130291]
MKTVRVAAGLGFYGDSWEPVKAAIERGGAHYVCSDHLAELTLAILRKDQAKDPAAGFTRDLVPMLTSLWPAAAQRGVKFVLNAGGLHPEGARDAVVAAFKAKGWHARVAVVTGDALLPRLDALQAEGESLAHLDTGASIAAVRDRLVFANAYLGAAPIVQALAQGAEIVITGRVADAALFLAPLVHEFGWPLSPTDAAGLDRLAQGLAVGHLLECSGQGAGGNFGSAAAWARVPDLTHIGYPIAEVAEDGSAIITKAPGTGGRINFHTVRQQLLYEVHDPRAYLSPDVVLDMGELRLDDLGSDRVRLRGARGRARPPRLKVVAGYEDGWMGQAVVGFCWPDAMAKARAVVDSVKQQMADRRMATDELCVEFIGHDAFLGPHADRSREAELNEVWLRMAVRCADKRVADAFPRLFPWMALSGPPYMGGFHGIAPASQLLGLWPTTLQRERVESAVQVHLSKVAA